MSLEDFTPSESSEGGVGQASEAISEAYKESSKRAGKGIKRTQKDEKKAKRYDFLLAKFLVEMILKKKYDSLLDELFSCLDAGYGTNFLLGILSLIYLPISHEIRSFAERDVIKFNYTKTSENIDFDDMHLPTEIRMRVNEWISDMEIVVGLEVSSITTKRTLGLILYDDKIRQFTARVFAFFFFELNINISEAKSRSYAEFILSELEKKLKHQMPDLEKKWSDEGLEI